MNKIGGQRFYIFKIIRIQTIWWVKLNENAIRATRVLRFLTDLAWIWFSFDFSVTFIPGILPLICNSISSHQQWFIRFIASNRKQYWYWSFSFLFASEIPWMFMWNMAWKLCKLFLRDFQSAVATFTRISLLMNAISNEVNMQIIFRRQDLKWTLAYYPTVMYTITVLSELYT